MCSTCGCSSNHFTVKAPNEEKADYGHASLIQPHIHGEDSHYHNHHFHHSGSDQEHAIDESHSHSHLRIIAVEQDILHKNNLMAERNRGYMEAKNIFALNMVSSPGSGKTSLLEKTIRDLGQEMQFYIIEGDQQSMNDANRIAATGAPVVQVNTGMGCHLDAEMVGQAIKKLNPAPGSFLFIENVGNLVCPSMFDLGENKRVVIISVAEGDDKPVKYPTMFQSSQLCIINKIDLVPYVDFDIKKARAYALQANHQLEIIELSVKTGEGMDLWYEWLKRHAPSHSQA